MTSLMVDISTPRELVDLESWCEQLRTGLSDCFRGVDLFETDMEFVLRYQLPIRQVTLPRGKVKDVVSGLCVRLNHFTDRWEQLYPGVGSKLSSPISPNWTDDVDPPPILTSYHTVNKEIEEKTREDLYCEYEVMGTIEVDPNQVPEFIMSNFPIVRRRQESGDWWSTQRG